MGWAGPWNVDGGWLLRPVRDGTVSTTSASSPPPSRDIADNVGIDPARVYATGISNGGMMAYKLACNTAIFAAIGPDAATQLDACRHRIRRRCCTSTAPTTG